MQAIASGWNWMAVFAVVKITPISFGELFRASKADRPIRV